jgi:hypothetical protein
VIMRRTSILSHCRMLLKCTWPCLSV